MGEIPAPKTDFDRLCLEVLKAIGKTLSQMNLYSAAHPAVKAMIAETAALLGPITAQAPKGELAYSLDGDKLIANGRIIGRSGDVPSAVPTIFARFKIGSLTFLSGVDDKELAALCQLAALRPEAAKGADPAAFLGERGVSRIRLEEAAYAKIDKDAPPPAAQASGPVSPEKRESAADLIERAHGEPLERAIEILAREISDDPQERARIFEAVMQRIRAELEQKVKEATSELRKDKAVLQTEQVRTRAVLDNMAEGVVVVDDQGRVLMMNPAAEEIYGVGLSQIAGKPLAEYSREEHLLTLAKDVRPSDDSALPPQVTVQAGDGARKVLRASSAIVQTESGKPIGMISALPDAAKHRELDKKEREFVAHVTHELRAPLTAIRAALEILEGAFTGKLKAEEDRILGNALRNTDRLEDLINGILDFSKIESGQMTVYPRPTAPEKLGQEAVESMRPWAIKRGIDLSYAADSGLPEVLADPKRSTQILINLLSNAIKFTPKDGRISVSLRRGPKQVVFGVSDTGPGIAKADQQKIFEKFVQIAAGERNVGGTGLGLAIAKALAQMQQGQMWIESEVGQGAKFFFSVPEYVPAPGEAPAAAPVSRPAPWWKRLLGLAN